MRLLCGRCLFFTGAVGQACGHSVCEFVRDRHQSPCSLSVQLWAQLVAGALTMAAITRCVSEGQQAPGAFTAPHCLHWLCRPLSPESELIRAVLITCPSLRQRRPTYPLSRTKGIVYTRATVQPAAHHSISSCSPMDFSISFYPRNSYIEWYI